MKSIILLILISMYTMAGQKLDNSKLFVEETGKEHQRSIIFLHGVGSSSLMWSEHMKELNGFHCLAPDLPGHGRSNACQWTDINEVSDWVAQLIRTECNGKASIAGLSLGGGVAMNLINRYPQLIDRAIIDGQSLKPIKEAKIAVFAVTLISPFIHTNIIINLVAKMIGIKKENKPNFKRDMKLVRVRSFRRAFKDANSLVIDDSVSHITSPILFVSGEKESETMHDTHRKFSSLIPGSRCYYYPGKGHGWLAEDVKTHVNLFKYWFDNGTVPGRLVYCGTE